jgi:hypothetical protein
MSTSAWSAGTFKPGSALLAYFGAIGNGNSSHEQYSSSPSKTLRAAMGFSFHSTGCVKHAEECWNESDAI